MIAATATSPYSGVLFTSLRNRDDPEGYERVGQRMFELASQQLGFLGVESECTW